MQHCLNKNQINQLMSLDINDFVFGENPTEFETLYYGCINWETELNCLTFFLSHILEIKTKQGATFESLTLKLHELFEMQERIWLSFQELDVDFVDYLFRHVRDESLNLEETLVQIQTWLSDYRYV